VGDSSLETLPPQMVQSATAGVGALLGFSLGALLGFLLGALLGALLGEILGELLGALLGETLGELLGTLLGETLGLSLTQKQLLRAVLQRPGPTPPMFPKPGLLPIL
jgi:outer membrane lipoprotein SlyB